MSSAPLSRSASIDSRIASRPGRAAPLAVSGGGSVAAANLPAPRVLLCDLDGTLVDSMPTLAELATDVMGEIYGTPRALSRELYVATCGLPFIKQLESIFPGDARNPIASDLFEGRKPERCSRILMTAEVERTLSELKRRGTAVVVSSNNGVENVATFAEYSRFPFDMVLGFGGGLAKGKPHFDRVASAFDANRSEMLFIGDSLHDGEIAEREGVPFIGLAGTFSVERFGLRFPHVPVMRRFSELPGLLAGGAWAAADDGAAALRRPVVANG